MRLLSERRLARMNRAVMSGRILPYLAFSMLVITFAAGFLVWALAPSGVDGLDEALWWAAQTVTTVGYGDVVPTSGGGRLVAVIVTVFGVAAVSLLTAVVTSTVVAWHQRQLAATRSQIDPHLEVLERIERRLDALEQRLS